MRVMKKVLSIILGTSIAATSVFPVFASSSNQLDKTGSFEVSAEIVDSMFTGMKEYLYTERNNLRTVKFSLTEDQHRTGTKALEINVNNNWNQWGYLYSHEPVQLKANTTYIFRWYAKGSYGALADDQASVSIRLKEISGIGTEEEKIGNDLVKADILPSRAEYTDWAEVRTEYTPTSDKTGYLYITGPSSATYTVFIDDIGVYEKVSSPIVSFTNGLSQTSTSKEFTLTGDVDRYSSLSLKLNGGTAQTYATEADGKFSIPLTLDAGNNSIEITADADDGSQPTTQTVNVNVILSGATGMSLFSTDTTTANNAYTIVGDVEETSTITIYLNDEEYDTLENVNGIFSSIIGGLSLGENEIKVSAVSNSGTEEKTVKVVYDSNYEPYNLMGNGDFESGISGWTVDSNGGWTVSASDAQAATGTKSLLLHTRGSNAWPNAVADKISLKAGVQYDIKWKEYLTYADTVDTNQIIYQIRLSDSSAKTLINLAKPDPLVQGWNSRSMSYTPESDITAGIHICAGTQVWYDLYIDDIVISPRTSADFTIDGLTNNLLSVGTEKFVVTGTSEDDTTITVKVDGKTYGNYPVASGAYAIPVEISGNKANVELTADNGYGNTSKTIKVIRTDVTVSDTEINAYTAEDTVSSSIVPGGKVKANCTLKNMTGEEQTYAVIIALYDGNNLVSVKKTIGILAANEISPASVELSIAEDASDGLTAKLLVWDSLSNLKCYMLNPLIIGE